MKIKSVSEIAQKDITQHFKHDINLSTYIRYRYLFNKKQRKLNKELGIHKINMFGNTNGRRLNKRHYHGHCPVKDVSLKH